MFFLSSRCIRITITPQLSPRYAPIHSQSSINFFSPLLSWRLIYSQHVANRYLLSRSYHSKTTSFPRSGNVRWKWVASASGLAVATLASYAWFAQPSLFNYEEPLTFSGNTKTSTSLDFEDLRLAYKHKSTPELLISYFVFKLCSFTPLVKCMPSILSVCETLHITPPLFWAIKHTVFKQFCGGENEGEVIPVMQHFHEQGIGSILDFSIEADLIQDKPHYQSIGRDYRAESHHRADAVLSTMKTSIDTAAACPQAMVAVKVTALGSPILLETMSNILNAIQVQVRNQASTPDGKLDYVGFRKVMQSLPGYDPQVFSESAIKEVFSRADGDQDGLVDEIDVAREVVPSRPHLIPLFQKSSDQMVLSSDTHLPAALTDTDVEDMQAMISRLDELCQRAQEKNVKLMIDAEQSYFQPAIDYLALHLARVYNHVGTSGRQEPLIYNTYQMYLKCSYSKLKRDLAAAQRDQFHFGAKLVRGAYMVSERDRARICQVEDPVHNTLEDTHHSYNQGIDAMLEAISDKNANGNIRLQFMVASHNTESVKHTCRRMKELGIQAQRGDVSFGQLMGMKDFTTFSLAKDGYSVFKYIPYGPIENVVPYLLRRAQENNAVLGGNTEDAQRIKKELGHRFYSFLPFSISAT